MNINSVNYNQTNTNFGALKELKFIGKLKDSPMSQAKLLDVFEKSAPIKRFCETFDTKVCFDAYKDSNNVVQSRMVVLFNEISEKSSGLKNWLKSFIVKPEKIRIDAASPTTFSTELSAELLGERMQELEGTFTYRVQEYEKAQAELQERVQAKLAREMTKRQAEVDKDLTQKVVNERIKNLLNK